MGLSFEKSTGCRKMDINSNVFYRWGGLTLIKYE